MDSVNTLPNNQVAESHIIGLTLMDKRIPFQAQDLSTSDFYHEFFKAAWSVILELDLEGKEADIISVFSILKDRYPQYSDKSFLVSLSQTYAGMVSYNPLAHVEAIKNCSLRRSLMRELNTRIGELSERTDVGEILRSINERFGEGRSAHTSFRPLSDILEREVKPALENLASGKNDKISTGFEVLDKTLGGGLSLSDVMVIAGLPASGKSAFALKLATNIAKQNIPVAFLSGEMSDKENVFRLISQEASFFNLNSATYLGRENHHFILQWAEHLKQLPIFFDSKTSDLQKLNKNLRGLLAKTAVKVLVIDYIQLLKTALDKQTRHERISEASQEVKRIALEFGIAVIEVAQFNREGAKATKPSMHDLEGSGQLEKDASIILILDRSEADKSDVTFRIVKGRNTGLGSLAGRFTGMTLNFEILGEI